VSVRRAPDGTYRLDSGSGGLVTALSPVLQSRGGVWIGWPGLDCGDDSLAVKLGEVGQRAGYELVPVYLTGEERLGFYHGFSNEVVWPLFHDLQSLCNFDPGYWRTYLEVNRKYAGVVAATATVHDLVWVHDYHLMGVGERLRDLGFRGTLAFFLHIPFPPPDVFLKLPWRSAVLRSLLAYDTVGFQTRRDRRNFADCVRDLLPDVQVSGRGQPTLRLAHDNGVTRAGSFPIGIDFNDFYRRAAGAAVTARAAALRRMLPGRQLILGVDRLDYTKGIPERLRAFGNALERYPELRERVTLIQVAVPSREDIPRYRELKAQVENLVGQINGRFTRPGGWVPIHYVFRSLSQEELLAYYRAAQIALVTPLKDGMNLVAKEYGACSPDEDCVLVLSEFAGAAAQLADAALLVNPYDVEGMADAIHAAFVMPPAERRARMRRMRRRLRRYDVFWWVECFIGASGADTAVAAASGS
jgi:trehalose 6-phosphate synthase